MKFILPVLAVLSFTPVHADFADDANTAIRTLQDKWYDTKTGLWYVFHLSQLSHIVVNDYHTQSAQSVILFAVAICLCQTWLSSKLHLF